MNKNPQHTCWLLCAVGAAYASNGMVANDNIDIGGVYASAKPASPANDMDRPAVPKTDVALTSAIIFTSSVLSGAIMLRSISGARTCRRRLARYN